MPIVTCSNCGGTFPQPQRDGAVSNHACAPLSEAQALAKAQGTTVAALAASQGATATALTPAARLLVGTEQDRRVHAGKPPKGVTERRVYVGT